MSDLPLELVEEILSRVPALSLKRLRSTCKRWNVLFKDQRFSMKHFDRAAKNFLACMFHENKFISLTVNVHDNNIAAPFIKFKGELGFTEDIKQVLFHCLFHCGGLFLCKTKKDRLVVWNPCTGGTKFIIPSKHCDIFSMFALGYENNKSCRNYKVLRYRKSLFRSRVDFEIYEFSSGSWRVLEVTASYLIASRCVSLKGNTYWLANDYNLLLCFDFSTERFLRLHLPYQAPSCSSAALSIVREEKLSVLHQRFDTLKIEVWVTTSDKNDETIVLSWKRFLAVDILKVYGNLQFSSCLSFFIDEEKKLVVCFCEEYSERRSYGSITESQNMVFVIGEYNVYKEIDFGEYVHESGHAPVVFNYTPSLVQIQESKERN